MTAVTAVTDHTDHADRPGDEPSEDIRPGEGRSGGDRPEGDRSGGDRPEEGHFGEGRPQENRAAVGAPGDVSAGNVSAGDAGTGPEGPEGTGRTGDPVEDDRTASSSESPSVNGSARETSSRTETGADRSGEETRAVREPGSDSSKSAPPVQPRARGQVDVSPAPVNGTPLANGTPRTNGTPRETGVSKDTGVSRDNGTPKDSGAAKESGATRTDGPARTGTPRAGEPSTPASPAASSPASPSSTRAEDGPVWDDGLIARRVNESAPVRYQTPAVETRPAAPAAPAPLAYDGPLRSRLDALRELVGLSRARLDSRTLAEAGRVLDEAAARRKLSGEHTVVAIAGATGSGKSQLFNALAGVAISETGVRRPTTSAPIACSWSDGAATLIDRLGIPGRLRRRPLQSAEAEAQLRGLVLVDLPDHDSAAVQHREQVDRVLALVDAVIWVVDPEKYADAILHERYLRPLAGHAEVTFVVLNQVDRLPGEAADQVLDDLRRLLDEDGIALGEYGEPGATVLALSALTGEGIAELRECLGQFVGERGAAARRISADLDAAAARLRPVYATGRRVGLSEEARDEFADRLADAVGAVAAGEAAERAWRRNANRACGTPWLRLWRWYQDRREPPTGRLPVRAPADEEATARQRVEQAVRTVADRAAYGLPAPWAQAVREAAVRGAQGLSEALDDMGARAATPVGRPPRPGWWPVAVLAQAAMTIVQVVGGLWLAAQIAGIASPNLGVPVLLMVCGIVGGPAVEWSSRMAARGPARRYGLEAERRLREAAAGCGRARVLDPVAAELLRYREVREQYGRVMGAATAGTPVG
ncbi:GTPase [Streptomyces sp. NPDC007084]|uniref:GTPase n=1 Tax=Streptomyces sp. NPDC007084 TaxID=3154313 RepID=UPI003454C904